MRDKRTDRYNSIKDEFPEIMKSYEELGSKISEGPLDKKSISLIKLGMSIAAGLEGATHSSTRKALDAGCSKEEIRHAAISGITTIGFPTTTRGSTWVDDVLNKN